MKRVLSLLTALTLCLWLPASVLATEEKTASTETFAVPVGEEEKNTSASEENCIDPKDNKEDSTKVTDESSSAQDSQNTNKADWEQEMTEGNSPAQEAPEENANRSDSGANNFPIENSDQDTPPASEQYKTDVPYQDQNGVTQICPLAMLVTEDDTSWTSSAGTDGWYVVDGNVTIDTKQDSSRRHVITVDGDVHLILMDDSSLTVQGNILANRGQSISIHAQSDGPNTGTLIVEGISSDSAIGASKITITGGNIRSEASLYAMTGTGIGAAYHDEDCSVSIYGGTIYAVGSYYGAGIGTIQGYADGEILINGGNVTAYGQDWAAGIGGAGIGSLDDPSTVTVTINGGTVNAASNGKGAGIGGGAPQSATIEINGGNVTAKSNSAAGIGGGNGGPGSHITITGGTVTATTESDSFSGAAIGGGGMRPEGYTNDEILITGGDVTATTLWDGEERIGSGAAIGGGYHEPGGNITISGGNVKAICYAQGAGIGGGLWGDGGTIQITGGTVEARSVTYGAGIGGGSAANGGTVTISGGNVTAYGGSLGLPAIGGDETRNYGNGTLTMVPPSGWQFLTLASKDENSAVALPGSPFAVTADIQNLVSGNSYFHSELEEATSSGEGSTGEDPTPTPAPTPAVTPSPTATLAPEFSASLDSTYYTCSTCGYHDWTATAAGYRCDHCGHVESGKQLDAYGNVKGHFDPAAVNTNSTNSGTTGYTEPIPQTGDESAPALWAALCGISTAVLAALAVVRRKRQ